MSSQKTILNVTNIDDKNVEESLSKISLGSSFVKLEEKKGCFLLINGRKDIFKSFKTNLKSYTQHTQNDIIETYFFKMETNKLENIQSLGKVPRGTSFFKCLNLSNFVYCYGGLGTSPKGEIKTNSEMYCFNLLNNEWSQLMFTDQFPGDRFDFSFNKLLNVGILYGGISLPKELFFNDLWFFNSQDQKWTMLDTTGENPGKLRGHSAEFIDEFLYLFGGQDEKRQFKNEIFKLDIDNLSWCKLQTKGKSPEGRVNHEMRILDKSRIIIIGGIQGLLSNIEKAFSDIFILNINNSTWEEIIIESSCLFKFKGYFSTIEEYVDEGYGSPQFLIFGGYSGSNNGEVDNSIFLISENFESYEEIEPGTENQQNEEIVKYQKEKIENYIIELQEREKILEFLKNELDITYKKFTPNNEKEEEKKNDFKNEELIQIIEGFQDLINSKQKLKYILQRKNLNVLELMSTFQDMFIKYIETLTRIQSNSDEEQEKIYSLSDLSDVKTAFIEKLKSVKNKMSKYTSKENELNKGNERLKHFNKSPEQLFMNDQKDDDSLITDNNINN